MVERSFFDLRYALPGYTFILMAILVSFPILQSFFIPGRTIELGAALIAFLSLLSGGALGFLISQIWHSFFNERIRGRYFDLKEMRTLARNIYGITTKEDRDLHFSDYLHRLSDPPLIDYVQRRWDLLHACGSTLIALGLGSFSGGIIRILNGDLSLRWPDFSNLTNYDLMVILIIITLTFLLFIGLWRSMKEHAMGSLLSVRQVIFSKEFSKSEATQIFPSDWFIKEITKNSTTKKEELSG